MTDLLAIAVGLDFAPAFFAGHVAHSTTQPASLSPIAVAMMMITIFAFAGTYTRQRTPLDIGDTTGLVRGICCAALLLAIGAIATPLVSTASAMSTASVVLAVLVAERELMHVLAGQKLFSTSYAVPGLPYPAMPLELSRTGAERNIDLQPSYERNPAAYLLKRTVDVLGAAALLVAALPLLLGVAVLIKIDSRGPALIRQRRIGRGGVPFYMWKFRSMHMDVARYARSPISESDPRLTRFGRALRRFSVDELPQLLNVLLGDMSLVGPRPEMPFIVKTYDPWQRLRLNAIPGITGLWQISPARAMPIHENVELDLLYIAHQDVFLDIAILLRTFTAVFRGIGAR